MNYKPESLEKYHRRLRWQELKALRPYPMRGAKGDWMCPRCDTIRDWRDAVGVAGRLGYLCPSCWPHELQDEFAALDAEFAEAKPLSDAQQRLKEACEGQSYPADDEGITFKAGGDSFLTCTDDAGNASAPIPSILPDSDCYKPHEGVGGWIEIVDASFLRGTIDIGVYECLADDEDDGCYIGFHNKTDVWVLPIDFERGHARWVHEPQPDEVKVGDWFEVNGVARYVTGEYRTMISEKRYSYTICAVGGPITGYAYSDEFIRERRLTPDDGYDIETGEVVRDWFMGLKGDITRDVKLHGRSSPCTIRRCVGDPREDGQDIIPDADEHQDLGPIEPVDSKPEYYMGWPMEVKVSNNEWELRYVNELHGYSRATYRRCLARDEVAICEDLGPECIHTPVINGVVPINYSFIPGDRSGNYRNDCPAGSVIVTYECPLDQMETTDAD